MIRVNKAEEAEALATDLHGITRKEAEDQAEEFATDLHGISRKEAED
jgi:hypothetical protein